MSWRGSAVAFLSVLALLSLSTDGATARSLLTATAPAAAPSAASSNCTTVYQYIKTAGDLTYLSAAIAALNLSAVLNDPKLEITLFAPTDLAFINLLTSTNATVEQLLSDPYLLAVIEYHIVALAFTTDLVDATYALPTLEGQNVTIALKTDPDTKESYVGIDGFGGHTKATVVSADIPACKSVIDAVDTILLPNLDVVTINKDGSITNAPASNTTTTATSG